jgi:2-oxoglutarate ferredoxin oxidoreductase subunit delta
MAKGEIVINEALCKGCGYCVEFCPKNCIEITKDKFNAQGTLFAVFSKPDDCNACGICVWMCPSFAVDAYKYVSKIS